MPALLVHYTFALSAIPESDLPYREIVNLGAQGPDAFMAYGAVPWWGRDEVSRITGFGHAMHRIDVGETYFKMAQYAKNSNDSDLLFAYLDGVLMHYCVDRIMHAYIFYRSGVDEKGRLSGYFSWSHGFFEAILDKTFALRRGTYQKLSKCIACSNEEQVKAVSKMWKECAPSPLRENDFYDSYVDFVRSEDLLWNPHGLKRPLFRLIGKYKTPNAQAHPVDIHKFDVLDVANDKKREWLNPATGEKHFESIDEMFSLALKDFEYVHSLLERFKEGEDIEREFKSFTAPLDHEGGPVGKKKEFYSLCWEALGKTKYLP